MIVLVTIQFEKLSQISTLLGSIAVLFGFIVLMLRMEKNSLFGAYVVAFRKSFINTMKTLPFIVLLFIGFIFSFKMRSNNGVSLIANSEAKYLDYMSVAKMTNMIIGGYELREMGLDKAGFTNELANFLIYFIFLILMTIISVNLLTGIAIGELESALKEAQIFNIQQRISYTLRIQKIIYGFERTFKGIFKGCKKQNFYSGLMVFKNDGEKESKSKISCTKKLLHWFRKNTEPGIEFLETNDKDISEYFNEAEYNARVTRDYVFTKLNENEYRLINISDNIETHRIEQMKKINDIDLSVAKNERQLSDINERFVDLTKKVNNLEEKLGQIFLLLEKISKK